MPINKEGIVEFKLNEFKLIKNRQEPDLIYSYVKKEGQTKYTIFTMNGGLELLLSIEIKRNDGKYYSDYEYRYFNIDECIEDINEYRRDR